MFLVFGGRVSGAGALGDLEFSLLTLMRRYTLYASSALSAMSLSRNLIGSVFPLFTTQVRSLFSQTRLSDRLLTLATTQLYSQLGVKGAGGLTAGLGAALAVTPFVLFRYGARLRARSPFALELARLREAGEIH